MARTSSPPTPPDWITQTEFLSAIGRLGGTATDDQLERWRGEKLLPAALQTPTLNAANRPAGSTVRQLDWAARQAVAVERAVAKTRSFKKAGAILWLAGFEVDERYWRPGLGFIDQISRQVGRRMLKFLNSDDLTGSPGDRMAKARPLRGVLHKVARKAGEDGPARFADLAATIVAGQFSGFEPPILEIDDSDSRLAERALGIDDCEADHVNGRRLNLKADLEAVLATLSVSWASDAWKDFSVQEIAQGRDDARNALKVAHCTHEATAWIYGRGSFGLRIVRTLSRFAEITLMQALAVNFARLRRRSNTLPSSDEIASLAADAEKVWLLSMRLRAFHEQGGKAAEIITPNRLKSALTDSVSHQNLLRELASHEFAKREFRPWDQWRKSAGRTMSPGLLAMSIGAPETIAFDDLVGSMSDPAIP